MTLWPIAIECYRADVARKEGDVARSSARNLTVHGATEGWHATWLSSCSSPSDSFEPARPPSWPHSRGGARIRRRCPHRPQRHHSRGFGRISSTREETKRGRWGGVRTPQGSEWCRCLEVRSSQAAARHRVVFVFSCGPLGQSQTHGAFIVCFSLSFVFETEGPACCDGGISTPGARDPAALCCVFAQGAAFFGGEKPRRGFFERRRASGTQKNKPGVRLARPELRPASPRWLGSGGRPFGVLLVH